MINQADEGIRTLDVGGQTFGNIADISDEALAAARLKQVQVNQVMGSQFESAVLDALGLPKNTAKNIVHNADGSITTTIFDAQGRAAGGFLEIKNVQVLSLSPQLSAQLRVATANKAPYNLVVSMNTKTISAPLVREIEKTGGQIYVFDDVTGKLFPWVKPKK